eukprot:2870291-Lingulodinium_polyedra.AAC.1
MRLDSIADKTRPHCRQSVDPIVAYIGPPMFRSHFGSRLFRVRAWPQRRRYATRQGCGPTRGPLPGPR